VGRERDIKIRKYDERVKERDAKIMMKGARERQRLKKEERDTKRLKKG